MSWTREFVLALHRSTLIITWHHFVLLPSATKEPVPDFLKTPQYKNWADYDFDEEELNNLSQDMIFYQTWLFRLFCGGRGVGGGYCKWTTLWTAMLQSTWFTLHCVRAVEWFCQNFLNTKTKTARQRLTNEPETLIKFTKTQRPRYYTKFKTPWLAF